MINSKQLQANIEVQKIALAKAQSDYNRRVPLGNANLIGREELQHARDAVTSARAQLDVAIQQYNANQAMILGTKLEDQPAVQQAATEVRNAPAGAGAYSYCQSDDRLCLPPRGTARAQLAQRRR